MGKFDGCCSGGDTMNEEKVRDWIKAADKLKAAKSNELELRNEICDHILAGKIKGAKKGVIGVFTLTATAKLNSKIDKEVLDTMWPDLTDSEKECFKFKPEIIAKPYKTLDVKSKVHQAITTKPGTPGLELKGVK